MTIKLSVALLLALSMLVGCATQTTTKTVKKETVQYPVETAQETTVPVVVESQTVETTAQQGESTGLLSGTVHAVGQILALPFRAAGGLIGLIF